MAHNRKAPQTLERTLFIGVAILFLISFGLYIYFISASVVHVIVHKEIDQEIASLNSYISELETEYIAVRDSITLEEAHHRGFVAYDSRVVYIGARDTNLVRATNDEI